ncbi:uncharacterized protein LOC134769733 [Penaeus indicus]|uniref:uncharacterized protein LOC134769733 n=1 Tax=Penaeus indicus TaxID=29960 RepID=UPI00300CFDAD
MEYTSSRNNGVNGAGSNDAEGTTPGRCPMGEQRGPGRHHATARTGWTKEMNIAVMECYFLSNPVDENALELEEIRKRMVNVNFEEDGFKKVERTLLRRHVKEVNNVLGKIVPESISGTNNLIKACTILIGRKVGLRPYRKRANGMKEPCIRRAEATIKSKIYENSSETKNGFTNSWVKKVNSNEKPDAIESKRFWSNIWDNKVDHKKDAEWMREIRAGKGDGKQNNIRIATEMVIQQTRKIPNWKCPGPDGVQGYWLKSFTALHERIADQLNDMINNEVEIPKWMTTGKTVLCQKDPGKGNAVDNYRPISCLPLMWKLMTGIISNVLYDFLEDADKLPNEQKGCRGRSRGTKDQLLIDKTVLNDCRKRHTNLGMAWIDYKKAYDMVPHSWILESLELANVADNVISFIMRSMRNWNVDLTSCGEFLGKVNIRRGIFQGDSLSPLLFVICMILLTDILRKVPTGYTLKCGLKLNHLLFMDDLKIYGKNEREINGLVSTVEIFSNNIGMEFGAKKCGTLILKRGKVVKTDGLELPSGDKIKEVEDEGYKYLGITEFDKIKDSEVKESFRKEYLCRAKAIMKSRLHGRNKIMAMNTWAVSLMRYGAGIIKWNVAELDEMDRKTRKIMTMNEFHPKSDVDRLYVTRSKGGRGLIGCKSCVVTEENSLGWYVRNHDEPLLVAVKGSNTIPLCQESMKPNEFKELKQEDRINTWKDKAMHGQYLREMEGKDKINTWRWLQENDLKDCTEALICSAQEQALRTNYTKFKIDKTIDTPFYRMCGNKNETVTHIISECSMLAQREYKRRHDNAAKYVHWRLCEKI